jgi:CheY-like chemotaxis protein
MLNSPTVNAKPRVILADDNPAILERAAAILSSHFDIAKTVADGRPAVNAALELNPDAVVLDVAMPVLDGISAALELKARGVQSKIVFLSMHGEEDYIAAALAAGAYAYVIKARMASDLRAAVDYALQGRMFVSKVNRGDRSTSSVRSEIPRWWKFGNSAHALESYRDDNLLVGELSEIALGALNAGDGVILLATQPHLAGIRECLQSRGVNLASMIRENRYIATEVDETLTTFSENGKLNLQKLVSVLRSTVQAALRPEPFRLFAYGEMAPILYSRGLVDDALRLEQAWSDVIRTDSTFLLCGYSASCCESIEFRSILDEHEMLSDPPQSLV